MSSAAASAATPAAMRVPPAPAPTAFSTIPIRAFPRRRRTTPLRRNVPHHPCIPRGGRCTDCGECSRLPQNIPLHLLNRKFIKDIDSFYGEFQAGETADEPRTPLTNFTKDDVGTTVVSDKGGDN